jgi:hypothetical protein
MAAEVLIVNLGVMNWSVPANYEYYLYKKYIN